MDVSDDETLDWLERRIKAMHDKIIDAALDDSPEIDDLLSALDSGWRFSQRMRRGQDMLGKDPFIQTDRELLALKARLNPRVETDRALKLIIEEEWEGQMPERLKAKRAA